MKVKHIFGLLLLIQFLSACEKNKNSGGDGEPQFGWCFQFIVVGSTGNNVFDPLPSSYSTGNPLPPNRDTTPFDPAETYFVDGLGQKFIPRFSSSLSTGMFFGLCKDTPKLMIEERDSTNSSTYQWLLYLTSNRPPDTLRFKNSSLYFVFHNAEFITFNSDTIYKTGQNLEYIMPIKIQYP